MVEEFAMFYAIYVALLPFILWVLNGAHLATAS